MNRLCCSLQVLYPCYLMNLATANIISLSIFEVVKIIWALLIHETTAINVLDLLDCEVSCDWVMFINVNQWDDYLETFTAIQNHGWVTDNRLPQSLITCEGWLSFKRHNWYRNSKEVIHLISIVKHWSKCLPCFNVYIVLLGFSKLGNYWGVPYLH